MSVRRATIEGRICDAETGRRLEARVSVVTSTGEFLAPPDALFCGAATSSDRGHPRPGNQFFASSGSFVVGAPRGPTQVIVERGTEYTRLVRSVVVPRHGRVALD